MVLCSHNNTTCDWIWPLFSGVCENISGCKNICPRFVTRIKLTRNSTIGCTSGFGCVWMTLIKPWKSRLDSSIGCILVKFRIVTLFLQQNTTTGWIHLRFSGMYEDVPVCKNIFSRFVTCIKLTRNSIISCILFKIRIMMLCSHNNTTYGWTWPLFSDVYKIYRLVKTFVHALSPA